MSDKSALTADDDIVVPGTKAASAKLNDPEPLRGNAVSGHWLFSLVAIYRRHVWKLTQGGLIGLVIWSNAVWHWTPNNYLAVLLGIFAARILSGIHCRVWHLRRGLAPPPTVPFGSNLLWSRDRRLGLR